MYLGLLPNYQKSAEKTEQLVCKAHVQQTYTHTFMHDKNIYVYVPLFNSAELHKQVQET